MTLRTWHYKGNRINNRSLWTTNIWPVSHRPPDKIPTRHWTWPSCCKPFQFSRRSNGTDPKVYLKFQYFLVTIKLLIIYLRILRFVGKLTKHKYVYNTIQTEPRPKGLLLRIDRWVQDRDVPKARTHEWPQRRSDHWPACLGKQVTLRLFLPLLFNSFHCCFSV